MDPNKIPLEIRETFLKHEEELRNKYVDLLESLPLQELISFDKNKYKTIISKEFKKLMPECDQSLIKSAAHFISNTLNNDVPGVRGRRKTESKRRNDVRQTEISTEKVTIDSTINNDVGSWDDETFIFPNTQETNKQTTETQDDEVCSQGDQQTSVKTVDYDSTELKTTETTVERGPRRRPTRKAACRTSKTKVKSKVKTTGLSKVISADIKVVKCMDNCQLKTVRGNVDMIQCNFCQKWLHEKCVNISSNDTVTFWLCPTCRAMPQSISDINTRLDQIVKVNEDLVKQLAGRIADIQELQSENARLRVQNSSNGRLNKSTNSESKSDSSDVIILSVPDETTTVKASLLVGDSIIQDITPNNFNMDSKPMCEPAGKINDLTAKLLEKNESDANLSYNKIIIHCGTNDAMDPDFSVETFKENYELLVNAASNMSDSVIISGLCPRLDDVFGNIHKANGCLKSISSEMSIEYVENEPHFRNRNKTVNTSLFKRNNIHLSIKGSVVLANNLGITSKPVILKFNNDLSSPDTRQTRNESGPTRRRQNENDRRRDHSRPDTKQNKPKNDGYKIRHNGNTAHNGYRDGPNVSDGHQQQSTREHAWSNKSFNKNESRQSGDQNRNQTNRSTDYRNEANDWQTVSYKRRSREHYYNDRRQTDSKCWYCGEPNHTSSVCRHGKELVCRNCDGRGHKAKFCPYDSYDSYSY